MTPKPGYENEGKSTGQIVTRTTDSRFNDQYFAMVNRFDLTLHFPELRRVAGARAVFGVMVVLRRQHSRGRVTLAASNPYSAHAAERRRLLDMLADLCTYAGMQPDELVASCVRTTKAGDRAISAKGRRAVQETIERFVAERGLAGHQAIVAGNTLRGFLIHNGIFMQGPASIR